MLRRRDRGRGALALIDIAAPGFDAARYGRDHEMLLARIHGVLPDGTVIEGMEVFRRAYAAVGLGWVLAPSRWPLLGRGFDAPTAGSRATGCGSPAARRNARRPASGATPRARRAREGAPACGASSGSRAPRRGVPVLLRRGQPRADHAARPALRVRDASCPSTCASAR
jgi:hypothetical protein